MDLDAERLGRIEELDEQGEATVDEFRPANQVLAPEAHKLAERFALFRSDGDDGLIVFEIGDLPGFADGLAGRKSLSQLRLKPATAPNPVFEDGLKN
jgi:hypothetical protein